MKYQKLIDAHDDAIINRKWLDMADLLTDDFLFVSPLIEIEGKINYIKHNVANAALEQDTSHFTILHNFYNVAEDKYYQIFMLESIGAAIHFVIYHQEYRIKNGLISRSILATNQLTAKIVSDLYPNLLEKYLIR